MALYLARHGDALSPAEDPERGLSPAGKAEVERIASVAAGYEVRVARIEHSPKKRARETAEIWAAHLKPPQGIGERDGIKPMDDVSVVAAEVDPSADLMLVGHLPFMGGLTGLLVAGSHFKEVFRFQTGGVVCLDAEGENWFVKWALMPNVG